MNKKRSHSKIATALSSEDLRELNKELTTPGVTYDDIVGWLGKRGYQISRSAVGRYGKDFLTRLERLKEVETKARAIVSDIGDGLAMEEAASKIFVQKVLEHLLTVDDLAGQKFGSLMMAFSKLQASSTAREKLKADLKEKVVEAADEVKKDAKSRGLSEEAAEEIRQKILGIA